MSIIMGTLNESLLNDDVISEMCSLGISEPSKRPTCLKCRRPENACWCRHLPDRPLSIRSRVIIVQHPAEEKRSLKTAPMLQLSLPPDRCLCCRAKLITDASLRNKWHELQSIINDNEHTYLIYPESNAVDIRSLPVASQLPPHTNYNLIVLDGTWAQTQAIYTGSPPLQRLPKIRLDEGGSSAYLIRTQPTTSCMSTVEAVAHALAIVEDDPTLLDTLVRPLKAMCEYQMSCGAVRHHSKQELLETGRYEKRLGQRLRRRLKKTGYLAPLNTDNDPPQPADRADTGS